MKTHVTYFAQHVKTKRRLLLPEVTLEVCLSALDRAVRSDDGGIDPWPQRLVGTCEVKLETTAMISS